MSENHSSGKKRPESGPPVSGLLGMSVPRILVQVVLPATLAFMMNMIFGLVDAYWVGRLGAQAMAAVSAAGIFTWILYSIGAVGQVGVQALVSQSSGAGRKDLARRAVAAGILLQTAIAVMVLLPIYLFRYAIFASLGIERAVLEGCVQYMAPFMVGMFFYFPAMAAASAFYAVGNARTPAVVLGTALVVNAALDPLFILGWGPIPRWGLWGAGFATAVADVFYTVWMLRLLRTFDLIDGTGLKDLRQLADLARRIFCIGTPVAANGIVFSGVYLVLVRILAQFGNAPIAALGVAHRIEGIAWFICVGFSVAAGALAGQLAGAGKKQKAVSSVWNVTLCLSVVMAIVGAFFMAFGQQLTAVFIQDPAVIKEGGRYLFIIGLFEIFLGWEVVYEEALPAVGAPLAPFVIATPVSLLRIPLAWFMVTYLDTGIAAVWWILSVTTLLKGMGLAAAFSFGSWRERASLVDALAPSSAAEIASQRS